MIFVCDCITFESWVNTVSLTWFAGGLNFLPNSCIALHCTRSLCWQLMYLLIVGRLTVCVYVCLYVFCWLFDFIAVFFRSWAHALKLSSAFSLSFNLAGLKPFIFMMHRNLLLVFFLFWFLFFNATFSRCVFYFFLSVARSLASLFVSLQIVLIAFWLVLRLVHLIFRCLNLDN